VAPDDILRDAIQNSDRTSLDCCVASLFAMTTMIGCLQVKALHASGDAGWICCTHSLPTCNEKPTSRMRPLRCAAITFLSREIHSELSDKQRTIVRQILAMMPGLF
jgi:hypothetical protein